MNQSRRRKATLQARDERGFTLIQPLVVVALTLYAGFQTRARIATAQAHTRGLAAALTISMGQCGMLPPSGAEVPGGQCNGSGLTALAGYAVNPDGTVVTAP